LLTGRIYASKVLRTIEREFYIKYTPQEQPTKEYLRKININKGILDRFDMALNNIDLQRVKMLGNMFKQCI